MDVCTLVFALTMNLVCLPPDPPNCEVANGKRYCDVQPTCKSPSPWYDCVRPDGSHYTEPLTVHPAFIENDAR